MALPKYRRLLSETVIYRFKQLMVGKVSLRNYSGQVEELIEYPVRKPIVSSCSLMVDLGNNAVIVIKNYSLGLPAENANYDYLMGCGHIRLMAYLGSGAVLIYFNCYLVEQGGVAPIR